MLNTVFSLFLSIQLMCASPAGADSARACPTIASPSYPTTHARLWWGLIDPELSAWMARLPLEEEADEPIIWDWSWRNFLAALLGQPLVKEDLADAPAT